MSHGDAEPILGGSGVGHVVLGAATLKEATRSLLSSYKNDPRPERLHLDCRIAAGGLGDPAADQIVKLAGTPGDFTDRHCKRPGRVRAVKHHQDAVVVQGARKAYMASRERTSVKLPLRTRARACGEQERLHVPQEQRVLPIGGERRAHFVAGNSQLISGVGEGFYQA